MTAASRRCSSDARAARPESSGGGGAGGCGGGGAAALPRRLDGRVNVEWVATPGQHVRRALVAERDFHVEMALGLAAYYIEAHALDVGVVEDPLLLPFCHGEVPRPDRQRAH